MGFIRYVPEGDTDKEYRRRSIEFIDARNDRIKHLVF